MTDPLNLLPLVESNDLLSDLQRLRERIETEGYLFFRELVPPDTILDTRRDFMELVAGLGLLAEGSDPMDGVVPEGADVNIQDAPGFHDASYSLESFHSIPHHPAMLAVCEALIEGEILSHPRNIARVIGPTQDQLAADPHQDHAYIRGTHETYTAWIPLGDCPREVGGLALQPRTHKQGNLKIRKTEGFLVTIDEDLSEDWLTADFGPGDVVFMHSLTVHRGLPNRSSNRLRVSMDCRYQSVSDPIWDFVLEPINRERPWEEVYRGWKSEEFQHYWKNHDLNLVGYGLEEWPGEDKGAG